MSDRNRWRGNSIPVKVNTVAALHNRSIGLRGWNHPCSPLHHYADRMIDQRPTVNERFHLPARTRTTFITAFSNDGALLASCHGDHNTHVFDVKSKKIVRSLSGHARSPWCVAFHPRTNDILATGSLNGEVRVWDLRGDGSESWTLELPDEDQVAIASLSFHPYDQVLAIAGGNEIYFWDWSLPQPFASTKTNTKEERVRLVRFDPWGHSIITGVGGTEESDESDSSDDTDLGPDFHPSMSSWTLSDLPRVVDSDLPEYPRHEISETHQRILHARVSVNEEIRQQYTRLQRLRQERHRLEIRLRELQDSANEVRNTTPSLAEPEVAFVENRTSVDHNETFRPYATSIANSQQSVENTLRNLPNESELRTVRSRRIMLPSSPAVSTSLANVRSPAEIFRDRLEAYTQLQIDFPDVPRSTSEILSQLRQRRIQRESNPTPYPSLGLTYFQPRIAPYVFFPEFSPDGASEDLTPSFPGRPHSLSHPERVLRRVPSIETPPLTPGRLSAADDHIEASRHQDRYATFFPPRMDIDSIDAAFEPTVLEQIPNPGAEVAVEIGHSQETQPSTPERSNSQHPLSAGPMWSSLPYPLSETESVQPGDAGVGNLLNSITQRQRDRLICRRRRELYSRQAAGNVDIDYSFTPSGASAATALDTPQGETSTENQQGRPETTSNDVAMNTPYSNNSEQPGTSQSAEVDVTSPSDGQASSSAANNASLAAAHSLSVAVNSLIEAADNLNEAADSLLHDASAASNLLGDSDSSSTEGTHVARPTAPVPDNTQLSSSQPQSTSTHNRHPPSLRHSSLRATISDMDRDRRRRVRRASSRRGNRPRHPRRRPPSRSVDNITWSRPRRFTQNTTRRFAGPNSINRIISDVYAEHHGGRSSLLGHDHIIYRLQYWDFSKLELPEICSYRKNVIVESCKIYNDTSVDISRDGRVVAAFIPVEQAEVTHSTCSQPMAVAVFSLQPKTFGQILFRKGCEHNLVCLNISPLCNRICVGFRYRHCLIGESRTNKILMGHVFAMENDGEMPLVQRIYHPVERNIRLVSINTMTWSPQPGGGLTYGTNTGDVRMVSISPSDDSPIKLEISRL